MLDFPASPVLAVIMAILTGFAAHARPASASAKATHTKKQRLKANRPKRITLIPTSLTGLTDPYHKLTEGNTPL